MKMKSSVSQLVFCALMIALGFVLMYVGLSIIPAAPFLKLEISFIPVLILAKVLDVKYALLAAFCINMLDFFFKGTVTGLPIDQMINFIAMAIFLLTTVYFNKKGNKLGTIISVAIITVMMVVINYFVTVPWYMGLAGIELPKDYLSYIVSVYGTFNLIKWGIVGIFCYLENLQIKNLIQKAKNFIR